MKRLFELICDTCGLVHETLVEFEAIPEVECPRCKAKNLRRKYSSFSAGSCGIKPKTAAGG